MPVCVAGRHGSQETNPTRGHGAAVQPASRRTGDRPVHASSASAHGYSSPHWPGALHWQSLVPATITPTPRPRPVQPSTAGMLARPDPHADGRAQPRGSRPLPQIRLQRALPPAADVPLVVGLLLVLLIPAPALLSRLGLLRRSRLRRCRASLLTARLELGPQLGLPSRKEGLALQQLGLPALQPVDSVTCCARVQGGRRVSRGPAERAAGALHCARPRCAALPVRRIARRDAASSARSSGISSRSRL